MEAPSLHAPEVAIYGPVTPAAVTLRAASRGMRARAAILDGLLVGAAVLPAALARLSRDHASSFVWSSACALVALSIYQWVLVSTTGQSLGKRWVGIRVVFVDGSPVTFQSGVLLRSWVFAIVSAVPGLGYFVGVLDVLWIFGAERRCLHDYLAGTMVIEASARSPMEAVTDSVVKPHERFESYASNPGGVALDQRLFRQLQPETRGLTGWLWCTFWSGRLHEAMLAEHLAHGDSRAAIVIAMEPLPIVAAYSDDIDCVVLLRFEPAVGREHRWSVGTRLLTVNTYEDGRTLAGDLTEGPRSTERWTNFHPVIAELVSSSRARIDARKREITEEEWERTASQGAALLSTPMLECCRDGTPLRSGLSAC